MMHAAEPASNRYFRVLDLDVEICCPDPEIGSAIDRLLHVFARPDRVESARRYEVARDATREWNLTCGAAVHAGVVASAGAVVAFPGESGAGKSTITAACLVAGFDYVSDEALCIDVADGRVVAYPKPIALASSGWAMIGATDRAATGIDDGEEVYVSADQL